MIGRRAGLISVAIVLVPAIGLASSWAWTEWSARKALQRGNELMNEAHYAEAVGALSDAISLRASPKALQLRAVAYSKVGDNAKTIADLTTLIQKTPNRRAAYQLRAETFLKVANYGEAVDDLNTALRLSPEWVRGYALRGEAYQALGHFDDAMEDMDMAVALQPTPENYYKRGLLKASLRRYSKAITDFTIAIELDSSITDVYRSRASALEAIGDSTAAQADLLRAASARPNAARD